MKRWTRQPTFKMQRKIYSQRETLFRSAEERDAQVKQYRSQEKKLALQQRNLEAQLESMKIYRKTITVRIRELLNLDLFEEDKP